MRTLILISTLWLVACNSVDNKPGSDIKPQIVKDSVLKKVDSAQRNFYDANHLKQGVWDLVVNNKIKGYQTFKNDTLHGPSRQWINYPEQIMTQEFYKGVEHGFRKYYEGKSLNMVVKYDMGKDLWAAFPSVDAQFPKPIKGMTVNRDSVYIECKYANDTIWYKGLFLKNKVISKKEIGVGIHKMYFPNGRPRFEYNYSTLKIKTFDSTGKLISDKKDDGTWFH
jgi:antitoxin component YwqK of YwqJK toxin-antitoxin module